MTSDDAPGAETPGHVPLPPEQPRPATESDDGLLDLTQPAPEPDSDEPLLDLTKDTGGTPESSDSSPEAESDPARARSSSSTVPGGDVADTDTSTSSPTEWWRGGDIKDEWRNDWQDTSGEAAAAAQEVGWQIQQAAGHISDAVAATAYPAAQRRGLDIRWMRLSINIPAIVLALLATWGGRTATDRMVQTVTEDGLFAPIGFVLFFVLAGGLLLLTPIGTPLAQALAHLVTAVAQGLVALVRRAWSAPVTGYLMRLLVAVFVWAFIFAIVRVAGRAILHWLTGV